MIETESGMDSHSLEIKRNGKHVGYIQWHTNREPHISLTQAFEYLTLNELERVLEQYKAHRKRLSGWIATA